MERVEKIAVAKNEGNDGRRIPGEDLGPGIGAVIQFLEGALDAFPQLRIDVGLIVHDTRDSPDGDTGASGDVADRHSHGEADRGEGFVFMNLFMKSIYYEKGREQVNGELGECLAKGSESNISAYIWTF